MIRCPAFYASNKPKSVLAQDLGDYCDSHKKLANHVSYGYIFT